MATSRTALIPFLASMTCPPFRRRSYFGSAAAAIEARPRVKRVAAPRVVFITSAPPRRAPLGRPLAAQVFAHVEAPSHFVARHLAREVVGDGVAALLAQEAADPHAVAVDRAREVAGDEVPAVRPVDVVP